jgi:hypothetical protein
MMTVGGGDVGNAGGAKRADGGVAQAVIEALKKGTIASRTVIRLNEARLYRGPADVGEEWHSGKRSGGLV